LKFFKLLHEIESNLKNQFEFQKFGGELQCRANHRRPPRGMGAGETPDGFSRLPGVSSIARVTTSVYQRCSRHRCLYIREVVVLFFSFPVFATAATAAPPLAAAATRPSLATPVAPKSSPHPRAPREPVELAQFRLDRRGAVVFHLGSPPFPSSPATVVSRLQSISASTDHSFMIVVRP
jgi:hypothetical protein